MIVDIGHDHQFIGARFRNERIDARTNRIGRADNRAREHAHRLGFFPRRPVTFNVVDRRLAEAARTAEDVRKGHLLCRRQPARFVIAVSGDDVDAYHRVGTVELLGRFEVAAIDMQRRDQQVRCEMRGEGIGQPEFGRQHRAEILDPKIHSGTSVPAAGTARMR